MKLPPSVRHLGVGALTALAASMASAVDTSAWKCTTCPFEKGLSGTVEAGARAVSGRNQLAGDFTGLDRSGVLELGGTLRWRDDGGLQADLSATDLGLPSRSIDARLDRDGVWQLTLGYDGVPRRFGDGTQTPFLGLGTGSLTLPAGYPAGTTAAMPLGSTLQPVDIGYQRNRLELGGTWYASDAWTLRLATRHETREGTWAGAGSFFATTSQLVLPVDQTTDQVDVAAHYSSSTLQFSLGYQASVFRNAQESLSWRNPFTPTVAGANSAALALAPDNQFHQLMLSAGWNAGNGLRFSGEVATGRMTQDSAFLPLSSNATLAVGALPAASLHGEVATVHASLRMNAVLDADWRLMASVARDERRNDTAARTFPGVSTDLFAAPAAVNPAYSFKNNRYRLQLDRRAAAGMPALAIGADLDENERSAQDAPTTRESRVWARASTALWKDLASVSLKLVHAERSASDYVTTTFVPPAENPLMRRFNMADRKRDSASVRADFNFSDTLSAGFDSEVTFDDYTHSQVGLRDAHVAALGADVAVAATDDTSVYAWVRGEQIRSRLGGSERFGLPDWKARTTDRAEFVGVGVKHAAMKGKLEIAAELMFSRARSLMVVDPGSATPAFPSAGVQRDTFSLTAQYKLQANTTVVAGYAYERRDAQDWRLDGLLPGTVSNLLALGVTPGTRDLHQLKLALRYRF